ncbi:hypothetical protein PV08_03357 [Exophiala spinifera]|uniref:NADH dehydrogenase [ubiquinone] 1 alpha subcomplex assembly factor 3 n=1 Tax=Exophiala spinifera TaxID=91928 RepID=A0A0D2A2C1_9EURO|nr:uncharacterized protein PV08_03357 [Exophiala spinifera]KIW19067.1 hypothetical protein PV08_03357 [Exophiala spinifera]
MRVPSLDLLRALRLATSSSSSSSPLRKPHTFHRVCTSPLSRPSLLAPPQLRPLSTSIVRHAPQASSSSSASPTRRRPQNEHSPPTTVAGAGTGATTNASSGTGGASTGVNRLNPRAPKSHDRGPASTEDTQTDFSAMDILTTSGVAVPATAIDACTHDGFHLNNGTQTHSGMGVMLLDGETFVWTPWNTDTSGGGPGFSSFLSKRGILTLPLSSLGVLGLLYPKPDLLIIGTGEKLWMLSKETRKYISEDLGIKVDVMDTPNAAAAYNLLATERGVDQVAALMIPLGFRGV